MAMNRLAMIETAMEAANDSEWGYTPGDALYALREMDPDYDWEPELLQAELEAGHREMGPQRPPTEQELALRRMYEPMLLKLLDGDSALLRTIARDYVELTGGSFTIPLEVGRNDHE
jgi:hypothetical protein